MKIVTGKPTYVKNEIAKAVRNGYMVEKLRNHPDGTMTVRMVLVVKMEVERS